MRDYRPKSIYLFHGILSTESMQKLKLPQGSHAFVCEGRPGLEAGRKTSSALLKKRITPTVISDNMAGFLFYKGLVKKVVLACQYADAAGALCDVGALILAVLAQKHHIALQLLVAQPRKRFLGDPRSILQFEGEFTAPKGTQGYVPLVEWVPVKYLKK